MQKCKNCSRVFVSLCTTVVHKTAQSSSSSYPPDEQQSSNAVYWKGGGQQNRKTYLRAINYHHIIQLLPTRTLWISSNFNF